MTDIDTTADNGRLIISTDRTHWEAIGIPNPADRLLATIFVNGCAVHLEAIRVETDDLGHQSACQADLDTNLDSAYAISNSGPLQTATITPSPTSSQHGSFGPVTAGDYVIVAVSHAT